MSTDTDKTLSERAQDVTDDGVADDHVTKSELSIAAEQIAATEDEDLEAAGLDNDEEDTEAAHTPSTVKKEAKKEVKVAPKKKQSLVQSSGKAKAEVKDEEESKEEKPAKKEDKKEEGKDAKKDKKSVNQYANDREN